MNGCAVGPNYRTPETHAPATWSTTQPESPATQPALSATQPAPPASQLSLPTTRPADVATWWRSLHDPLLDSLIDRAVASNLDLRLAEARVREARAQRGVVAADLWPQVGVSAAYSYSGSSLNTGPKPQGTPGLGAQVGSAALNSVGGALKAGQPVSVAGVSEDVLNQVASTVIDNKLGKTGTSVSRNQNLFQAGFDATWELDVFGGIRRAVEAADADIAASEESRRDALVTLLAEVALNYVQLRGSQQRLVIARENIKSQQNTVELTSDLLRVGLASELDVSQAKALLASTQSQVPVLQSAILQSIYQLSVLLAQPPGALLAELEKDAPIPATPPEVPIGLPSDLLRRRPDVRTAERLLAAATAQIGVATADLYPKFSLTGSFGPQSRDINHILENNSLAWSIGPGISWPILDGWRIRSNIEVQNARQEQALTTFEKTILVAFQDVETALVTYTNEQVRYQSLAEAVAFNQRSADLSYDLYRQGLTAFLNVLESQRSLYVSQDALVQSQSVAVTNLIALYKALGGGWEMEAKHDSSGAKY